MPNKGYKFNAKNLVKSIQTDINKEAKRQKLSIPVQTDVDFSSNTPFGHDPFLRYSALPNQHPTNITNNNFDNRGAIGNENIVIQNINNPQIEELLELISASKYEINALDIEDEMKEWLVHNLDSCKAEVESDTPKLSLIKRFTTTIQSELNLLKDGFLSLSKDVAPITTILVNVPQIYDLAKNIFGV